MKRFVEDMDTLVSETIAMSKMTAGMIERSVRSLMTGDVSLVEDIIDDFDRIDRYDSEIEVMAIRILTLYQPTAVDIRTVATVMKCITYLERMAKYSKNIAKATEYLADKPSFEPKKLIGPMGDTAVSMVKLVTQGFEKRSVDGFDRIVDMDNYLDDTMHENLDEIKASDILKKLGLEKKKYILLSAHREENIDTEKNFLSLFTAINKMAEKYDMPILYSCHPRSKKRLEASGFKLDARVIQHEPLGFHDYNHLQMNAFAVVSDSGTLPEESSFFTSVGNPFPAVCIRTSTERPEALDKACFILAGIDERSLLQAVDTAVSMTENGDHGIPVPTYVEENVSTKVVKIIQSYTGVVNKMVWRKF